MLTPPNSRRLALFVAALAAALLGAGSAASARRLHSGLLTLLLGLAAGIGVPVAVRAVLDRDAATIRIRAETTFALASVFGYLWPSCWRSSESDWHCIQGSGPC
jgi:hypothetical protein